MNTTVTIWLLIFTASGYRPAVVIERFPTAETCQAALVATQQWTDSKAENARQFPMCLKASVAIK